MSRACARAHAAFARTVRAGSKDALSVVVSSLPSKLVDTRRELSAIISWASQIARSFQPVVAAASARVAAASSDSTRVCGRLQRLRLSPARSALRRLARVPRAGREMRGDTRGG